MKSSTSGGHIVTLTSISGLLPSPTAITYSSTKASIISYMIGLTEKIRHEDFEQKIKTTCICLPSTKVERNYLKDETTLNVINAIIREENFITIPNYYGILIRLLSVLPLSTQQLARELFLKENF
jgi:NADP-dependent 3-hydroxy acid dehydrogenase YdfG